VLDSSAGTWPAGVAEEFARIALACCEYERDDRPSMEEVAVQLERLRRRAGETHLATDRLPTGGYATPELVAAAAASGPSWTPAVGQGL
jgi:hypothetical protein